MKYYDELIFDPDKKMLGSFTGKKGDTKSRGLYVKVSQNNVIIDDLTGLSMVFFYEKGDGKRGFINAEIEDSRFRVDYTSQVFAISGYVKCELRLIGPNDEKISSKAFGIVVDSSIADNSIVSKNERDILDDAFELADDIIPRIELLDVELFENIQDEVEGMKTNMSEIEGDIATNTENISDVTEEFNQHKLDYIEQRQQDQLKVSKVEKDINDYQQVMSQVNVNQEAKQNVSGYGTISLPKNTANGQVSASVKGETRTNLVENSETELILTNNSASHETILNFGIEGNKYLVVAEVYKVVGEIVSLRWQDSTAAITVVDEQWVRVGYVGTYSKSAARQMFGFYVTTTSSASKVRKQMCIDITGETETDISKLLQKYNYISSGTKSTISASRLKSVGKNLFDKSKYKGENDNGINAFRVDNLKRLNINKIFQMNKQYTIMYLGRRIGDSNVRATTYYTDGTSEIIGGYRTGITYSEGIGTTSINKTVERIEIFTGSPVQEGCVDLDTLIIREGTTATPYEPYTESTQYLPNVGELRSLPNETKDEIRVSGGKAELVKRVSDELTITGDDILAIPSRYKHTSTVALDIIPSHIITIQSNSGLSNDNANVIVKNVRFIPESLVGIGDTRWDIPNKYGVLQSRGLIRLSLADSDTGWDDIPILPQTKDYFNANPLTLTYQLAEPIITPIEVSGTLLSNPSGTVYVENVVADAGIYTTKFDIKELQLPIKSIDKLIKYNLTTGVQTVLDTSLAVINEDKKSFTHPNLTDKDMVFVDYYYDVESTLGETTIEYLDSRHTIKDTTNNKFYKWDIKSTNGVPTVELTEVL